MKLHLLCILTFLTLGCTEPNEYNSSRPEGTSTSGKTNNSSNSSAEDESALPPESITGTFLRVNCEKINRSSNNGDTVEIGCNVLEDNSNKKIDIEKDVKSVDWGFEGAVEVSIDDKDSDYHAIYTVNVEDESDFDPSENNEIVAEIINNDNEKETIRTDISDLISDAVDESLTEILQDVFNP